MYLCHSILWVTSSYCQAQSHKTGFLEKWSLSTGHSSFSGVASTPLRLHRRQSPTRSAADNLSPVLLPLLYQPQWEHPRPISFWWSVTSISSSFHMRRDQDRGMKNWFACVALRCSESERSARTRFPRVCLRMWWFEVKHEGPLNVNGRVWWMMWADETSHLEIWTRCFAVKKRF